MADKQKTENLQVTLENGGLNVETAHPQAGEMIKSEQLPGINWFFPLLAERMGLKGKVTVIGQESNPAPSLWDGEPENDLPPSIVLPPQPIYRFRGKSKNGEETEFSHNHFLPGNPLS